MEFGWLRADCIRCGRYEVGQRFLLAANTPDPTLRWTMAALSRQANLRGAITYRFPDLEIQGFDQAVRSIDALAPVDYVDVLDWLLEAISLLPGHSTGLRPISYEIDHVLAFLPNQDGFQTALQDLVDLGWIAWGDHGEMGLRYEMARPHLDEWDREVRITRDGWLHLRAIGSHTSATQGFVAMRFGKSGSSAQSEMNAYYDEAIRPAALSAGYTAVPVNAIDHGDRIDDRILAEIRKARFVIVDTTGEDTERTNPNVAFEAGFALALNKPIIWTCRKDWADEHLEENFDIRQYNHITWMSDALDDLRDRVQAAIENRVGVGPGPRTS